MSMRSDLIDVCYGIDFGTTNSACVGIVEGKTWMKFSDGNDSPFPSLIAIDKVTDEVFCGREAWRKRNELKESCLIIPSIKSHLGTDIYWETDNQVWTPEMVAAQIFMGLREQVSQRLPVHVAMTDCVVAIPSGFPPPKRTSLRRAAAEAGLSIKSFISEPTAAVFRESDRLRPYSKIAVFDWGGGTLDVSIVEKRGQEIREVVVDGMRLGGDDIDLKLALWVHKEIVGQQGIEMSFEEMVPSARDLMIVKCEQAKRSLSESDQVYITLNKYGQFGPVNIPLSLDVFMQLVRPEIQSAMNFLSRTIRKAGMSFEELGCVLMIGGSTQLACLEDIAAEHCPCPVIYAGESDWSVAYGAASLSANSGAYYAGESVGLELSDESYYPIVKERERLYDIYLNELFAIVNDSKVATFKFVNERKNVLGYLPLPVFGFLAEKIRLEAKVNQDMVLCVQARSEQKGESGARVWQYPALTQFYRLPEFLGEETS